MFTLEIVKDMLKEAGFEVEISLNSTDANKYIYRVPPPNLLLIDIEMPSTSGDNKVRSIKNIPQFRDIPVVLMSGKSAAEMELYCKTSGAEGYLLKPIDQTQLIATVNRLAS
jgi:CheY-like chemotaxis protein